MRPLKSFTGISKWLLRFALVGSVYKTSFSSFLTFGFNSVNYFIHLLLVISAVLFVFGAFAKRHTLTVLSSLFIFILYFIILIGVIESVNLLITYITYMAMALFFMANGNK